MLPDSRLLVFGGVQNNTTNLNDGAIYNPPTDSWSSVAAVPSGVTIGNGPLMLLADGRVLAGSITGPETYIYDPLQNAWSSGPTKLYGDSNNHESWTMLPDGSILCYDVNKNPQHAQRLDPTTMTWIDSGAVPVSLEAGTSISLNMGPGVLLTDGRVLQFGRSSNTAIYTPSSTPGGTGSLVGRPGNSQWIAGGRRRSGRRFDGGAVAQRPRVVYCRQARYRRAD